MRSFLLANLSILLMSPLYSQDGPGGVGTADGASSLVLWLDANNVTGTSGSTITSWPDASGYGHDFTAGNGAVFNSPTVNGYPAFNFNGSSHYFQRAFTAAITPATFTIFSATNVTSNGSHKAVISNRDDPAGSATAGFILYSVPSSNNWQFWTGRASGSWQITTGGTSTAGTWSGQVMDYQNAASGKMLFIDETLDATSTHSMTSNPSRPCRVGAGRNENATPNYYFRGDIGEVIMFNTVLNSTQKMIVSNYLAAKYSYGLTANDIYNEDDPGNGNYDHEVAGIGQVSAGNNHTDAKGTGIVRISNPRDLDDNEFLLWGHDNALQQAAEVTDVPAGVDARFSRVWRASEVNTSSTAVDVGGIDMSWDLTGLGSVTASDLRLLIDTDGDGTFADETAISGATSIGGNVYQFTNVTGIVNNLRFTLGTINNNQTPLPVELVRFEAAPKCEEQTVQFMWTTASEINNDYFVLERSKDASNWEEIERCDGAGNTTATINYTSVDKTPLSGVSFYRLKQVDFNGEFTYSQVESVNLTCKDDLTVHPNPTTDHVKLTGENLEELGQIEIYNALGEKMSALIKHTKRSGSEIVLDLTALPAGVYYITTKTTSNKIVKQ